MNSASEKHNPIFNAENDIQFDDIFSLDEIQRMQDLFSDATGVASLITKPDGTPITQPSNFCRLCQMVRSTEKGLANCIRSDQFVRSSVPVPNDIVSKPCLSAGLFDSGASITVDGIHIANWLIGQVRNDQLDEKSVLEYATEIGVDPTEFRDAFQDVPVMPAEKFEKVTEMLFVFANQLSQKAYTNHQLKIQIAERERANELLEKSEESLSITLQSIGDGVITTDNAGLVVNMNPIAEKLCGWNLADAKGRLLIEVFNIVNYTTRIQVENPVDKVLENGQIVGLANHTVLISNDGTEYHIADSAAPIKDTDGCISGVVLVFSDVTPEFIASEKIRKSELRYRGLLNTLEAGVVVHAPDTSIIMCNSKACELLGLPEDQLLGKTGIDHHWMFLNDTETPMNFDDYPINQIVRTKKTLVDFVLGIHRPSAEDIVWVTLNGFPLFDANGEITEVVISFIDISNRKCVEDALCESELFLNETQEIALLGTYTMDLVSDQWSSSRVLNDIFGIDGSYERTTETWAAIVHPEWRQTMADYFRIDVVLQQNQFNKVYQIIRPNDNRTRWVHGRGELEYDDNGNPVKMIGTIQDITDIKDIQEALEKSEEKYRTIFENVQDVFFQIDLNGIITEISPSISNYTRVKREDLIGREVQKYYRNANDRDLFLEELRKTGEKRDYELDLKTGSGRIIHTSVNARIVFDKNGNPLGIEGFLRDISLRKKAEDALRENERYLIETQKIARLGNCTIDLNSGTWKSSEMLDKILGITTASSFTYVNWKSVIHPDWEKEVVDYFKSEVLLKRKKFDRKFKIIRQTDKEIRWVHVIGELKTDDDNQPLIFIATVQDVTKRKQAAEALRASEALYRSTLKASPDTIVVVELDGRIRMVSPSALLLYLCLDENQLVGRNMVEFLAPEESQRAQSRTAFLLQGYMGTVEYQMVRFNGEVFHAEINGDIIWTDKGEATGMVFIIRDISERKKVELDLKKSKEQLKEFAAHLQDIREEERVLLAREIHDELGQILIAIKIDLGILKQQVAKSIDNVELMASLVRFDELYGLVDNTINTTRKIMTDLRPEVLDMVGFVEAAKLHAVNFQKRHNIRCIFKSEVSNLNLSPQQSVALYRILQESLANVARHSKATDVDINLVYQTASFVMEIRDNGIGFNDDQKVKRESYGLIGMKERSFLLDGKLSIESQLGKGTKVKIEMPYISTPKNLN
jgi:PAS domain S-box-containing protein